MHALNHPNLKNYFQAKQRWLPQAPRLAAWHAAISLISPSMRTVPSWVFLILTCVAALSGLRADALRPAENVPEPLRQFRGAWIASVWGINWPTKTSFTKEQQQAELRALLDQAVALRLNAIILQVRPACDAFYESKLEPWAKWLTGTMGKSPGYDPLKFAITEAHARGLELHAWINPFRALVGTNQAVSPNHISQTHPEWTRTYGTQKWIDPGEPKVRDYSLAVLADIVTRYDIDGLHFDDYFYPYPLRNPDKSIIQFPDDAAFALYGKELDRSAWRRANINDFVQRLYVKVKQLKPTVKVGVSPFGIHQPGVPEGIKAILNPYEQMGCDSVCWLQSGWCDYFTPQLYWRIDPPDQSFSVLAKWWQEQNHRADHRATHLWPGLATDRIKGTDDPERPPTEILRQMELSPTGHVHWNLGALMQDRGGLNKLLTDGPYAQAALVPASPWLNPERPPMPSNVKFTRQQERITLSWDPAVAPSVRWWIVQRKTDTGWNLAGVLPVNLLEFRTPAGSAALAVRGCSAAGLLGLAQVIQFQGDTSAGKNSSN